MKYIALLEPDNDLIIKGITCITSLQELYTSVWLNECTELEITKPFAKKYFTYQGLIAFVRSTAALFPNMTLHIDDTLYKDMDDTVRNLMRYETPQEMSYALTKSPERTMQVIHELCKYYFETQVDSTVASNKLATFLMQITSLQQTIHEKDKTLYEMTNKYNETYAALHALGSRLNFQYEKTIDVEALFHLRDNQFIKILYLKEITRVHYTDTMLYYLGEIIKTLYGEPIRTVIIGPYYSYKNSAMYPAFKEHWNLTYKDVYDADIYMAGFQPKVMTDILQNANHIHFLVVLDRSGCNAPFIDGSNVETVYTVSDLKDAEGIDPSHLISYSPDTLNIPYIENFEGNTTEEKIKKYSTMPVIRTLIDMLEKR